jgi:hypothetical protein
MAIAVTSRGYEYQNSSSSDIVFDAFQPAANSLLLFTGCAYDLAANNLVASISCDASWSMSTWTKLGDILVVGASSSPRLEIWGAIVTGSSPSSAAVTVDKSVYNERLESEIYEVTGVNVSGGTAASCIGSSDSEYWDDTQLGSRSLTLDAFASSENGAFVTVHTQYNADNISITGWTNGTERGSAAMGRLRSGWTTAEDTSVAFTIQNYIRGAAAAFEIKAAGGGSIVPQAMASYRQQ